jgi:hypothetical protein
MIRLASAHATEAAQHRTARNIARAEELRGQRLMHEAGIVPPSRGEPEIKQRVGEVNGAPHLRRADTATCRITGKEATPASIASVIAEPARDFSRPERAGLVQIMSQR